MWSGATSPGKPLGVLSGHTRKVTRVALCADGVHCASSSDDATVRVWDTAARSCVRVLEAHAGPALSVAVAGWGARGPCLVASGGADKTIRLWDLQADVRGRPQQGSGGAAAEGAARGGGGEGAGDSPPDPTRDEDAEAEAAATADATPTVGASGKEGGKAKQRGKGGKGEGGKRSGGKPPAGAPAQSGGKTWLDYLRSVEDWSGLSGKQPRTVKAHSRGVVSLAFSEDGLRLISGGEEAVVRRATQAVRRTLAVRTLWSPLQTQSGAPL